MFLTAHDGQHFLRVNDEVGVRAIEEWLSFPSDVARRVALARSRRRLATNPNLLAVGEPALGLINLSG